MFELPPEVPGGVDILLLALFGAAAEEDDEGVSHFLDPIAGAEIYAALEDAAPGALGVGEVGRALYQHGEDLAALIKSFMYEYN